jgi:rhodanese-related sulfurtransferase
VSDGVAHIDAPALKAALHDGGEIALLDAREEVPFGKRHLFMAACLPAGRLELLVNDLVPRRGTRIVWCDDGEGLADRAARRMSALGYSHVSVLEGGVGAWEEAGYRVYSGVHVPSKAFAEVVEHEAGTPWIDAEALGALIDAEADIAIFDSRSFEEYNDNSIPGAVSVPGAELVHRVADLVPSPETTIVVNCGGRTRSIIGAQSLINAGVPNRVASMKDGTMAWHLAGFEVVQGATRQPPEVSEAGLQRAREAAARVARRCGVRTIDRTTLDAWRAEADTRTLHILDVRTPAEFEAGHLTDARPAAGGQLVQETDAHVATWGARIVLVDDDGVRATMTASWLQQMGWTETAVFTMEPGTDGLAVGPHAPRILGLKGAAALTIAPLELQARLAADTSAVVDLGSSREYSEGHVPGAWFALRSRLSEALAKLPAAEFLVLTSPDGALARLAAADLDGTLAIPVAILDGGTRAWAAAGLPLEAGWSRMTCAADDVWLSARQRDGDREAAMREYLAWEIDLVNQMASDDDHRFRVVAD